MYAAANGRAHSVDRLIRAGATVNAVNGKGRSALIIAAANGSVNIIRKLLSAGANIHISDNYGKTPLMEAVKSDNPALLGMLIDRGADINARDNADQSALILALELENYQAARYLLEHGGGSLEAGKSVSVNAWKETIGASKGLAVVTLWDDSTASYRMLPVIDRAARKFKGAFTFMKLANPGDDVRKSFGVRGVPTVLVLRDGKVISQFLGVNVTDRELTANLEAFH
jgi:hypothetical protein